MRSCRSWTGRCRSCCEPGMRAGCPRQSWLPESRWDGSCPDQPAEPKAFPPADPVPPDGFAARAPVGWHLRAAGHHHVGGELHVRAGRAAVIRPPDHDLPAAADRCQFLDDHVRAGGGVLRGAFQHTAEGHGSSPFVIAAGGGACREMARPRGYNVVAGRSVTRCGHLPALPWRRLVASRHRRASPAGVLRGH